MIMTRPVSLTLSDEDRDLLQNVVYRGQNWRARERAKTLLLLGEGYSKVELAQQVGVHPRTVATTRLTWLKFGSAALQFAEQARPWNNLLPRAARF